MCSDGAWSSSDEVPPDGVIQMQFTSIDQVDAAMVQQHLKLVEPNKQEVQWNSHDSYSHRRAQPGYQNWLKMLTRTVPSLPFEKGRVS